jgi:glutamyl-tRNA reductase
MQGKLQSLSAEQRSAVEALTRGLINKVLHQPLQAMKAAARDGDLRVVEAVQQIFGLTSQSGGQISHSGDAVPLTDAELPKEAAAEEPGIKAGKEDAAERDAVEATRH